MCGICGTVHLTGSPVSPALLQAMNSRLQHRGPDGDGYHAAGPLGLAVCRLRIIDLAGSDQHVSIHAGQVPQHLPARAGGTGDARSRRPPPMAHFRATIDG